MSDQEIEQHNRYLCTLRHIDYSRLPFKPLPDGQAVRSLTLLRGGYLYIPTRDLIVNEDGTSPAPPNANPAPPFPVFGFLIERINGEKVIFDMGLRQPKDYTVPAYLEMAKKWSMDAGRGIPTILAAASIPLSSISTVLFGHSHFDHTGDIRPFPPSTSIIVGPDTASIKQLAGIMDVPINVLEERNVRYLTREEKGWVNLGPFEGFDLWGDGSLYLLDASGHVNGHVSALVRTSVNPPTFYLLASDTAHHSMLISPPVSPRIPRPLVALTVAPFTIHAPKGKVQPLESFHGDLEKAYVSIGKTIRMEEDESVCVLLAHDRSLDVAVGPGEMVRVGGTREEMKEIKSRRRDVYW